MFVSGISRPEVRVAKLDGTTEALADGIQTDNGSPVWSPDGQWLAFGGVVQHESELFQTDLWLIGMVNQATKRITYDVISSGDGLDADDMFPVWSPDGKQIVYSKGNEIWLIDLQTGTGAMLLSWQETMRGITLGR